jgi:hypothetical protein
MWVRVRGHVVGFHGSAQSHAGPVDFVDGDFDGPAVGLRGRCRRGELGWELGASAAGGGVAVCEPGTVRRSEVREGGGARRVVDAELVGCAGGGRCGYARGVLAAGEDGAGCEPRGFGWGRYCGRVCEEVGPLHAKAVFA